MTAGFIPTGTVYGTLLNQRSAWNAVAPVMDQPPHLGAPRAPVLYIKTANTFSASGQTIPVPTDKAVTVGTTLGLVLARDGFGLNVGNALQYVAGVVLLADLSLPHTSLLRPPVRFNCRDGFLALGSTLRPLAPGNDLHQLVLRLRVNGHAVQSVRFDDLLRPAATLLAEVCTFMTLRRGDVIMLGCAADLPLARAGDLIEVDAGDPAWGRVSNRLVEESA